MSAGAHLLNSSARVRETSSSTDTSLMVALGTPVPRSPTRPTSASRATTYRPERLLVMLFPEALSGASLLRCVLLSHRLPVSAAVAG